MKVYVDNHADFSNSATNWFSKNIIHRLIWKRCAQLVSPYTTKFYGVLPARVDFLHNIYKIPMQKIELLVMGADDEQVTISKNPYTRNNIRGKYNIGEDDILIVTGGKIDKAKKQTITLMKAIKSLDNEHLKLIVFGSVIEDLKSEFHALIDNDIIHYAGWVSSNESYNYFEASDLVVFPGRHSVFWEQVAGLGKPIIVKYWEGTNHVDLGGNCLFLHEDNEQEIQKVLTNLLENDNKLKEMSRVAEENKSYFSYENISKRAIDI